MERRRPRGLGNERHRPGRLQVDGVHEDHARQRVHHPRGDQIRDATARLLLDPAVHRHPRGLRVGGEVGELNARPVLAREHFEESLLPRERLLSPDRVRNRELELGRLPVHLDGPAARFQRAREAVQRVMDPLGVVEVQDGVHLRRGRPGGARPRHGEREQDARRREDEVVLVPLGKRRVEVSPERVDRANRRRRVSGSGGHPLDVGDRDRLVA